LTSAGRHQAYENKVPTLLTYTGETGAVLNWGFSADLRAEQISPGCYCIDWFKVYLDEDKYAEKRQHHPDAVPRSIADVEGYFKDFLVKLYEHIEFQLSSELPLNKPWSQCLVEFLFTVPTTWAPRTIDRFRSVISSAGYNRYHPSHSIEVGLTEPEAAAVSASLENPRMFHDNDTLLVCDVGGGTTDLGIMAVENASTGNISLRQLAAVQGDNIGSVKIDLAFERLANEKLQRANTVSPFPSNFDIEMAAWHMMKSGQFQNAKCQHGVSEETPTFFVTVHGLSQDYVNEEHGIFNQQMQFTRSELRALFDSQISQLFRLIDDQLTSFQRTNPNTKIAHLLLSGGLGNSAYVQSKLKQRYAFVMSPFSSAWNMQASVVPQPQLAVCRGIVQDRVRKLMSGTGVLGWRRARASYGTICKIEYNPRNQSHIGRQTQRDQYNGKLYLYNAIVWFIEKGAPVNSDAPISRPFTRKLDPHQLSRSFPTSVVTSNVDVDQLPLQLNNGTSSQPCQSASSAVLKIAKLTTNRCHGPMRDRQRPLDDPRRALQAQKPPLVEPRQAVPTLQLRRQSRHRPRRRQIPTVVRRHHGHNRHPHHGAVGGQCRASTPDRQRRRGPWRRA
jgi:hypothetical protein